MAIQSGQRTTLSDTVGLAIDISPTLYMIDPFDVGLLSYLGLSGLDKPATAKKHEWNEDTFRAIVGTTNEALDDSETEITVTSALPFRPYDVIRIQDSAGTEEILVVTVINSTTSIEVETRGTRSTAVAHLTGAEIQIIGTAMREGDTSPRTMKSEVKVNRYNYTQIFEDVVEISSTLEAVEQWHPGSEYARELQKVMKLLWIMFDKAVIFGKPYVGTSVLPRSMGGILHFLNTAQVPAAQKVDASGVQLSQKLIDDALMSTYDEGGNVRCFAFTLTQKQAVNKWLDPSRRTGMDDTRVGSVVDSYLWDNGVIDFVIDRWLPKSYLLGLDAEKIGIGPLAGETMGHEILPKTSRLAQKGQITGEYTLEFMNPESSFYIKNLATTIV